MVEETVRRFGGVHILVNNAVVASSGGILDATEVDWDRVFAINLRAIQLYAIRSEAHGKTGI